MKNFKQSVALLVLVVFGLTVSILSYQKHTLVRNLNQKDQELSQARVELKETKNLLLAAEQKLGYLDKHKTSVQVTAFCKQPNSDIFANGQSVHKAYAVKKRTLPEDAIVNVALSPAAQRKLNAKMGDVLVLMDRKGRKKTLAKFVDTTYHGETRPVIDVFFANPSDARYWGRRTDYYAVNLSAKNSPFRAN